MSQIAFILILSLSVHFQAEENVHYQAGFWQSSSFGRSWVECQLQFTTDSTCTLKYQIYTHKDKQALIKDEEVTDSYMREGDTYYFEEYSHIYILIKRGVRLIEEDETGRRVRVWRPKK